MNTTVKNSAFARGLDVDHNSTPEARGADNGLYVSEGSAVLSVVKSVINTTTPDRKKHG